MKQYKAIVLFLPMAAYSFSFEPLLNLFGKYKCEKIDQFEVKDPIANLVVINPLGNTDIRSWKNDKVVIKCIKQTGKDEDFDQFSLQKCMIPSSKQLTLKTNCGAQVKGVINLELMVPECINVKVDHKSGNICISGIQGTAQLLNEAGDIRISHCGNTITAKTLDKGSIYAEEIDGNLRVDAAHNVIINNAKKSIIAYAQNGYINASCTEVPTTSKLYFDAYKTITLQMPPQVSAQLLAKTERNGSIRSEIPVTIKPFSAQLNDKTWRKLKKEVEGTYGTGEAQIQTVCKSGSINIQELRPAA